VILAVYVLSAGAMAYAFSHKRDSHLKTSVVGIIGESVGQCADSIAIIDVQDDEKLGRLLVQFGASGMWESLRVISSDGDIVASLRPEERGTRHWQAGQLTRNWPSEMVTEWEDEGQALLERVTVRTPIENAGIAGALMLEGVVRLDSILPARPTFDTLALVIFGGSLVLLLLVCRMIHRQLQPLVSIGSNLVRHKERLHHELSSLRLANEGDAIAQSWNELVRLFELAREAAAKASATSELSAALERNATSSVIEAVNLVPEGVMYLGEGHSLRYANKMACRLLGIQFEDGGEEKGSAGTPSPPRQSRYGNGAVWDIGVSELGREIVASIKSAKRGEHFENHSSTVRGTRDSAFLVRVMPVVHKERAAVVLITDVSQRAKAEAAREAFVAQVTHELRTPLTNIRAYTETCTEFNDPKVQAECFNVINKETRRLGRLVEEMLSRSQLDVGTMNVRSDDVDLLALLHEAVRDLKATAENKEIELQAELPSKLPLLLADRDKLAVVINNLLGNTLKYTNPGGSISVGCEADEDSVRIAVVDTGLGIAEEHRSKIFERMYRVDSEEVKSRTGTGIGLTTAMEIVQAHGGDIQVSSKPGEGSTFTVELPLKAVTAGRGS
jgi:signal transduction histidine kinase